MAEAPDTVEEAIAALGADPTYEEILLATNDFSSRQIASEAARGGSGDSLPSWWTVDSTPGAESVEFDGVVVVEGGAGQGAGDFAKLFEVVNGDAQQTFYHDSSGVTDITLRDDGANVSIKSVANPSSDPFFVKRGNATVFAILADGGGVHQGAVASSPVLQLLAALAQTEDILTAFDNGGGILSRLDKNGYFMTRKTAAPADGDLVAGEMALWFDPTNGASALKIKAKQADGTVKTATVALA